MLVHIFNTQRCYVCQSVFDADPLKVTIKTQSQNGEAFHDLPLLGSCLSNEIRAPYTIVFSYTFINKEFIKSNIMTEFYHVLFD